VAAVPTRTTRLASHYAGRVVPTHLAAWRMPNDLNTPPELHLDAMWRLRPSRRLTPS
jgi:hypothetical protein